ncbi:MAG: T9SS type A sorting domain-containing protein [Bacteroidota bacterium]
MMEVYEHQAWDRLPNEQYNFFLTDVILSASVHDIFDGEQHPMTEEAIWKIDYFMVEQANKECSWSLTAREPICRPNELYRISISCEEYPETADYQSITWIVSDNLTIEQVCTDNSCIYVRLNGTSQDPVAVVEAHIPNDDSCHDYKIKKEFPIVGDIPDVEVIGECYTGLIYPFFEIPAGHYSLSILEENLTNINWILPLGINIVGPASNGSMLLNLEEGDSFVLTLEADTPCGRQTTNFNIQVTEGCGAGDNGTIIFPNPLTDQLSITSKKEIPGIFELYDLSFNALQTFEFPNGTSFQLDLSGFESGTYFLRLVGTNELRQITIVR